MLKTTKKLLAAVAALAALALGASAIAGAASSSSTSSSTTSSSAAAPAPSGAPPASGGPAHGTPAHENAETAVTGEAAAKARAAAVKSVGSGKAGAVTSDYTKTGYETTVTKADGSTVDVRLDSSFKVMREPGGPGGPGAPGGEAPAVGSSEANPPVAN